MIRRMTRLLRLLAVFALAAWLGLPAAGAAEPLAAEIRPHLGRPTVFIDGTPVSLAAYSPAAGWNRGLFNRQMAHFAARKLDCFFVSIGQADTPEPRDFFATPLWAGDEITSRPAGAFRLPPDEQAATILRDHPQATIIVRFSLHEPASWRELHADDLFVGEDGKRLPVPSLASAAYWDAAARYAAAAIEYAEGRPWADRIIGYANFMRLEGTHEPLIQRSLFDHGPAMTARWRAWLREKYAAVEKLRAAHGDESLSFEAASVPRDRLRGAAADVAAIPYWQSGVANAPLRDYLLLQRDLYHEGFRKVAAAAAAALEKLGRKRFLVHDSHKSAMLGWDNAGFFDKSVSWRHAYPELMAGSGNVGIAGLFAGPGIDGLITPHDYQARGTGGVFEPEGIADSAVLRGKLVLCEMDTRTWAGRDPIAQARDAAEFAAVTWRNLATALARGFTPYWMDVYEDWFAPSELQPIIDRQATVLREAVDWPHETVPGIAMILDDEAVLETNGDGRFLNEAVLWEWKTGLARCGVPVRIHLLDDLALPNFPPHRVFYFPNLFKIDAARRKLLEEKVLKNGHVVVWGPGTGISDGETIGAATAAAVTGFACDLLPVNDHRRTLLTDTAHPLTKGLSPGTVLGGPLAYGPVLLPKDGRRLGSAWTKLGRDLSGLAVMERAAADGTMWTSVFTSTPGLPAGFWRNAARQAGAHVWCETDDVVVADAGLVAIHAATAGVRRLRLPRECDGRRQRPALRHSQPRHQGRSAGPRDPRLSAPAGAGPRAVRGRRRRLAGGAGAGLAGEDGLAGGGQLHAGDGHQSARDVAAGDVRPRADRPRTLLGRVAGLQLDPRLSPRPALRRRSAGLPRPDRPVPRHRRPPQDRRDVRVLRLLLGSRSAGRSAAAAAAARPQLRLGAVAGPRDPGRRIAARGAGGLRQGGDRPLQGRSPGAGLGPVQRARRRQPRDLRGRGTGRQGGACPVARPQGRGLGPRRRPLTAADDLRLAGGLVGPGPAPAAAAVQPRELRRRQFPRLRQPGLAAGDDREAAAVRPAAGVHRIHGPAVREHVRPAP
jgi:hypothetical protein